MELERGLSALSEGVVQFPTTTSDAGAQTLSSCRPKQTMLVCGVQYTEISRQTHTYNF